MKILFNNNRHEERLSGLFRLRLAMTTNRRVMSWKSHQKQTGLPPEAQRA